MTTTLTPRCGVTSDDPYRETVGCPGGAAHDWTPPVCPVCHGTGADPMQQAVPCPGPGGEMWCDRGTVRSLADFRWPL